MSFSNEHIGGGADGGIFNFIAELPEWMGHDEVSMAYVEMDASICGIQEPPVAKLDLSFCEKSAIEDYRKFYIEFENSATVDDIIAAVRIVADAIKKYRYAE